MALNWLALIPWGTLIENAPRILDASKKLFRGTQTPPPRPIEIAIDAQAGPQERLANLEAAVAAQQQDLAALHQRQQESARLIEELAAQNAQLTVRLRRQYRLTLVLGPVLLAVILYLALR
ncbi:hypothetical protein N8I74_17980 [Chitiniphilus purpureus]|uniref:Uncharacterized protein n=1 Tax=Chitiniphilus purpureus TaxID=2981137 RepID=A0ABY6DTJ0_9NEIS|nr:hypothetical protein [Chitiniphilus sp. CD1]UXY15178.1 hypothetical protein N8I74_17980 [Chitiniphilus sp. CD1]